MIRRDDLMEAIAECSGVHNPNATTCIKLAAYYTILDHLDQIDAPTRSYYGDDHSDVVAVSGDSDFLRTVQGKDMASVLSVLDEAMTTLQIINPRLYDGIMRRL